MSYFEKKSLQISEMTSTPSKREKLENLTDNEKLKILYEMKETKNIIDLLDFIKYAHEDAAWCNSYR